MSKLFIRDKNGVYRPATYDEVLDGARSKTARRYRRGVVIESPIHCSDYLFARLSHLEREVFSVLFLDNRHRLLSYKELFQGTINGASVHPRIIAQQGLQLNASAAVIAHNHPSGVEDPSRADDALTKTIRDALGLVDIRLLDHIIIAGNSRYSYAEHGKI